MRGEPVYAPWPMFTWLRTPLYKQGHMSANQDGITYCGRDLWPPEEWWIANHEKLGLEAEYKVVVDERKGQKCGECQKAKNHHLQRSRDDNRGYWELAPIKDDTPVISLDALGMLVKEGLI